MTFIKRFLTLARNQVRAIMRVMFLSVTNHSHRVMPSMMLLVLLFLSGCATVENNHDPIEGVNRMTDGFNDVVDRATLKPIAKGYVAVGDPVIRKGISNFYDNAAYPGTIVNAFLQGKDKQGVEDLFRFLFNSTVGLLGLIDVGSHIGLEKHNEDFGQTLGVWGFSQGAYIVYPFFGPNSVRDTPALLSEPVLGGLFWASFFLAPEITIPLTIVHYIDKRSRLLDASDMRDELALDPYIFTRGAWRQNREYLVHDGNPPSPEEESDDDWVQDEWESDDDEEEGFAEAIQPKTRVSMQNVSSNAAVPAAAASLNIARTDAADGQMFVINLASFASKVDATAAQGNLAKAYIQTDIKEVSVHAKTWYRLYSSNHVRKEDAQIKLAELKARSGFLGVWLEPVH
jgi:phospholipid-binding lipoprotein MlaA